MQFPVPQFTDVEDKIIGSLTLKQFGIIFAAGIVIFLGFSATKSILVLIFLFVLFGIPALGLAFAPFNGRPIYNSLGTLMKFVMSPKVLIFHKEFHNESGSNSPQNSKQSSVATAPPVTSAKDTQTNLREIRELLSKTALEEKDIAKKMKE